MTRKVTKNEYITNWEALEIVRAKMDEYTGADGQGKRRPMTVNLKTSLSQTTRYLESTTTLDSTNFSNVSKYSQSTILELFRRLDHRDWPLEKGEYMMLFNLRPKSLVELELCIEEAQERFGEEKLGKMLEIIKEVLGPEEDTENQTGGSGETGQEAGASRLS